MSTAMWTHCRLPAWWHTLRNGAHHKCAWRSCFSCSFGGSLTVFRFFFLIMKTCHMSHHIFVVAAFGRLRNAVFVFFFQTPIWKNKRKKKSRKAYNRFSSSLQVSECACSCMHRNIIWQTQIAFKYVPATWFLPQFEYVIGSYFRFALKLSQSTVQLTHARTRFPAPDDMYKQYWSWCALAYRFQSVVKQPKVSQVQRHISHGFRPCGFSISFKPILHTHDYTKIVFGYQTSSNLNLRRPTVFDVPDYTITQIRNSPHRNYRSCFTISTIFAHFFFPTLFRHTFYTTPNAICDFYLIR